MGKLIIDQNPYVDEHLFYDDKEGFFAEAKLFLRLRKEKFDIVFDFMFNPKSCLYVAASRSIEKVSFESSRSIFFHKLAHRGGNDYIVQEKFRLLALGGFHPSSIKLDLPWFEKDLGPINGLEQEDWFTKAAPRIVIAPTHRRSVRAWPLFQYALLASKLKLEWNAEIIWLWGPGEEEVIDSVLSMTTEKTHKAPKTSFRELAALISHCDLFIGNSNGPSHVAVAAGIPSLQLHGPTKAASWCPSSGIHSSVQSLDNTIEGVSFSMVWEKLLMMKKLVSERVAKRRVEGTKRAWDTSC